MIGARLEPIGSGQFFNSQAVMKAITDAQRRVLSKFGAFVRQRAKSSMRPAVVLNKKQVRERKKKRLAMRKIYESSAPGQPPRTRLGSLRRLIVFAYDFDKRDVVIGPLPLATHKPGTPARLEYGGTFKHQWSGKIVTVKKRPYMQPAMEKERDLRMPAMFRDSLKAA